MSIEVFLVREGSAALGTGKGSLAGVNSPMNPQLKTCFEGLRALRGTTGNSRQCETAGVA